MSNKINKRVLAAIPRSSTSSAICYVGVLSFMISLYFIRKYNVGIYLAGVLSGLALVIPVVILEFLELKTFAKSTTGLDFKLKNKISYDRVLVKLIGLYVTLGFVAFFYWLVPEYRSDYYVHYWTFAKYLLMIIGFGSIPYFFILDKYLVQPEESYWKVGMIALGKWKEINYEGLKNHFLGWLVKAFFLPLMYVSLCGNIGIIKANPFNLILAQGNFDNIFSYLYNYIFTVDLVIVTVGYLLTLRIFDSHIRSVEPSILGWYVALQCYRPFWDAISPHYLNYNADNYSWFHWLTNYHTIYIIWGTMILFLLAVYSWSSVMFGIRFSNLTHRGIITNGPYRIMRHPAYVSKNLSWWMIAIPFISVEGFFPSIKYCLLLLLVNFLYFMRAKTEERHLSQDPVYVQYAEALNQRGLFSPLYKIFGFLKYNKQNFKG